MGADRIVNAGAHAKFRTAAIVVDFGSSICVDAVSGKGEFLGGAIAPGSNSPPTPRPPGLAALRRVELTRPRSVIGKNTVECMQAGAVFGFAGLVDGLITASARMSTASPAVTWRWSPPDTAPLLLPDLETVERYDQNLTLDGLRMVFERNQEGPAGTAQARPLNHNGQRAFKLARRERC